jgi:DNA-binding transcriptional LysR family regulator
MNQLRLLSFDDLLLMKLLLENYSLTSAAASLNLTQPAATQRIRKIETVFKSKIFERAGRGISLTREGRGICQKAAAALSIMGEETHASSHTVINIGTRAEVGVSWLWKAVSQLRSSKPEFGFNIHFGSGEEILRLLGTNQIDAALTSAPVTLRDYDAIEIAKEDYDFVARPDIAKSVSTFDDLNELVLLEHDRSFPFQRYIPAEIRSRLRFSDVWFLASSELMVRAALDGHGVAVVPKYLSEHHISKKKLMSIRLNLKLDSDYFRLIYSRQRPVRNALELLANQLKKIGLQ